LKRQAQNLRDHYDSLSNLQHSGAPANSETVNLVKNLLDTRRDFQDKQRRLADTVIDIMVLSDADLSKSSWEKAQIEDLKKWRKQLDGIFKSFRNIDKIAPNDLDISMLIYQISGQWH
jgi:hypothetical protein